MASCHEPDHLLDARAKPFVERLLQLADGLEAGMLAFHPAAHVENFEVAYAALTVPQQARPRLQRSGPWW